MLGNPVLLKIKAGRSFFLGDIYGQHLDLYNKSRVNTVVNSLFARGPRLLNDLMKSSPTCDIFHDTLGQIRRHVLMFTSSLHAVL